MEKIEKYKAFDGTEFDSEYECSWYEDQREKQIADAVKYVKMLSAFCNNMCEGCYFNTCKQTTLEPHCLFRNKPSEWVECSMVDLDLE